MSVQGTILVLDGVSTNRIMLKVQLTAAWYQVVPGEKVEGLGQLLRRTRPDLILTAHDLPDGSIADIRRVMSQNPLLADVPVVAIVPQNDKRARLLALADGADDVLAHPFKDTLLLARMRSLLRIRADRQDMRVRGDPHNLGFAEPALSPLIAPPAANVAVLSRTASTGALWRQALTAGSRHSVACYTKHTLPHILSGPAPDAIVIDLGDGAAGLAMLADLRSRRATRHTVLIAVMERENTSLAVEAFDRGADAVCLDGFHTDEVSLRLETLIARKTHDDRLRDSMRKGLAESLTDPLTGLHNRRYAMLALTQIVAQSRLSGQGFALMLADLDYFKTINDQFGHAGGDLVLTEVAKRFRLALGGAGFVARIGGEEFMIGLPDISSDRAAQMAATICGCICDTPFHLPDLPRAIPVTISVGLNYCDPRDLQHVAQANAVEPLIRSADQALYAAKRSGRNQVQFQQSAA